MFHDEDGIYGRLASQNGTGQVSLCGTSCLPRGMAEDPLGQPRNPRLARFRDAL